MYTKEQHDFIKEELKEYLYFFGYVDHESNSSKQTMFYSYDSHDKTNVSNINGYKQLN